MMIHTKSRIGSCEPIFARAKADTMRVAIGAAILTSSMAGFAPPAVAQSQGAIGLEEIVVTARRREESLQDVPIAITAVDEEYLRTQNISNLEELGTHVPSFRVSTGSNTNATIVAVRGQRPTEVLLTLDPAVPIYFADVPLTPTMGTNLAMYDLQNVQVLKGPQGTLFGRNSTGGAVLVTPKRPGDEFGGYAEVKIGDYDLVQFEGAVDLPVSDALKFRLAGRKLDRDGYQSNVADNALACSECYWDEDSYGLRLSMDVTPSDRFRNSTVLSYDENDQKPRVPVIRAYNRTGQLPGLVNAIHNGGLASINPLLGLVGLPPVPTETAIDNARDRQAARGRLDVETDIDSLEQVENLILVNTTEFEISDSLTVKNIIGYRDMDFTASGDSDGTAVPWFGSITSATEDFTLNPSTLNTEAEQWSEEFQLLGNAFDEKLEWILGAFWLEMDGESFYESQISGINPDWPSTNPATVAAALAPFLGPQGAAGIASVYALAQNGLYNQSRNFETTNEARAIFGEATYQFNDQWSLTFGARQTWDNREMTPRRTDFFGTECLIFDENNQQLPLDNCRRTVDEDYSEPTWRVAASYTPNADHLLYGSASTGYRAGGFNARGTNNATLAPYDQETVLNFEVGHKGEWQLGDTSIRSNIAIFHQSYDDIQKTQDTSVDGEFATTIVNAAEATIQGGEIELTILPSDDLTLSLNYSYVDASYDEWVLETLVGLNPDGSPILDLFDNSDADFTYIPESSMTGLLSYRLPIDPAAGEMTLTTSFYYQSEMTTNEEFVRWPDAGWTESDLADALEWTHLDEYTTWNVRLDWRNVMGSSFDAAIFSNNVTDEDYQLSGTTVPEILGLISTWEGPPRTYGASLRYNF